ncbi:MAG: ATP-binding protein [Chloroflexi bacterium]|nr:ATP-binding protein [Chloroflexota bacterium]
MAKKTGDAPAWVQELTNKYGSGVAHAFLIHFNVHDYVVPGSSMRTYLAKFLGSREVVCFYNRAEGITFELPSMHEKFMDLLAFKKATDPAVAALAAVQGNQEQDLPKAPSAALPLLVRLLKMGKPEDKLAAVIIEHAETIVPSAAVAMMSAEDRTLLVLIEQLGRDPEIMHSGNPVILLTSNLTDLHVAIRSASSKFEAIRVPLPDRQARLAFISQYRAEKEKTEWEPTPEQLANATAGLSLIHIEDIFLRAEQEKALTWNLVRERKQDIIASEFGEVLEILEPRFGFEMIGGLEHVKRFFRDSVINPMRTGNLKRMPMGILLTGPAGTGKTAVAEAVAFEAKVMCFILNPAKIYGKYVGDTERNLDRALNAIDASEQAIVFVDEMDQSVRRGESGDSGVSNRIFKRLIEFMSDTGHRGRIVFLAASNRPDLMDAALRRPGRFDKKIPFLIPDADEREAIFKVMALKYGLKLESVPASCVKATEGWTGAEIELVTVKAVEVMEDQGKSPEDALAYATTVISPSTADIEFMTLLAVRECNDKTLLPPKYQKLIEKRDELEAQIREKAPEQRGRREL